MRVQRTRRITAGGGRKSLAARLPLGLVPAFTLAMVLAILCAPQAAFSDDGLHLVRRAHYLMGTVFEISVYASEPEHAVEAVEEAFAAIRHSDEVMSDYRDDSDLMRLNRNGAEGFVPVPDDLYAILEASVQYARLTGGAFDATAGTLVDAWRQAAGEDRLPTAQQRRELLARTGASRILFDPQRRAVRFDRPGVRVDLGAIAKGWAVDRAAEVLRRHGLHRALINAGSSTMAALGAPPSEAGWEIGIRHPFEEDRILATVRLRDESLSTSASGERTHRIQGKEYSHIIDPRSGHPVEGMLICTVIAPTATQADALSTGCFVRGVEAAEASLRKMGLAGVLAEAGQSGATVKVHSVGLTGGTTGVAGQTARY